MWMTELPPFISFFIGALFALVTRGRLRAVLMVAVPVLSAIQLWTVPTGMYIQYNFLEYELTLFRADKLSFMFAYVFHIAALIAIIYALHVRDTLQQVAGMLYAGSALGAVFAGDLLTLFVFWELLAFVSVFLIWARRTQRSYVTGMRYLIIHVLSGIILLAGTVLYVDTTGSLKFDYIGLDGAAGWLIFIAFGIKCGFPLMHNWITEAYPAATPVGTVFLSAFTTKVAVYTLARGYPGTELLVYIGALMTCFPIFYAVIENDLRRVLAYSMINQVGFMVTGIGIGTALAINGAVAHAFNDVIFKALLFMSMGAVLHMTGRMNASELGGLYKSMPKTTILCIVGAASISAFPLFSGFVSKSMVMSAALENGYDWIWLMLLFASAGVFHHAGIKIPYFAFFAHDSGIRTTEPPWNMLLAMFIAACLCIGIGIYPPVLYQLLPYDTGYNPYTATHVLAQTQLLFFSALAFVWLNLHNIYPPELRSVNLDAEWIYRRLLPRTIRAGYRFTRKVTATITAKFKDTMDIYIINLSHHQTKDLLATTPPLGVMALWVAIFLAMILLLAFL
jgi:multicomponent Na+:H+ antiporter subunit D